MSEDALHDHSRSLVLVSGSYRFFWTGLIWVWLILDMQYLFTNSGSMTEIQKWSIRLLFFIGLSLYRGPLNLVQLIQNLSGHHQCMKLSIS